jgi:hypothetical protein
LHPLACSCLDFCLIRAQRDLHMCNDRGSRAVLRLSSGTERRECRREQVASHASVR